VTWKLAEATPLCKRATGWDSNGAVFAQADQDLDRAQSGPLWLKRPMIADLVRDVLVFGQDRADYELGAWVIMANHVHIVIRPCRQLWTVMRDLKCASAKLANRILDRTGLPFWDTEYYDRLIRNSTEEARITRYIERNPVNAGLCSSPELWKWGSAHEQFLSPAMAGATVNLLAEPSNLIPVAIHRPALTYRSPHEN